MPGPRSFRLDPPAVRIGWLEMLLRRYRRGDRDGLYRGTYHAMIAEIERLIADAARERAAHDGESAR